MDACKDDDTKHSSYTKWCQNLGFRCRWCAVSWFRICCSWSVEIFFFSIFIPLSTDLFNSCNGIVCYPFLSVVTVFVAISSIFKCVINRSRIWRSGRNFRITLSDSVFSISPTNMYLMWYLCKKNNNKNGYSINCVWRDSEWIFAYNKSQIESMYSSGASPRFLSTCSNISYNVVVISYPTRGRSWSNRSINGPNKWHT